MFLKYLQNKMEASLYADDFLKSFLVSFLQGFFFSIYKVKKSSKTLDEVFLGYQRINYIKIIKCESLCWSIQV